MVLLASAACLSEAVLDLWLNGRLQAADLPGVEAHVASCSACLRRIGARRSEARPDAALELEAPPYASASEEETLGARAELEAWSMGRRSAFRDSPELVRAEGVPELLAGRYELTALIGQGGMGEVYLGLDRTTGKRVAIKRLKAGPGAAHAEVLGRFAREAEILRRLDHPNIVKMLELVEGAEQHSIVMDYVAGGSLRRELARQPLLPPVEVLLLTLEVAEALSSAHRSQVIHRDVKPENVLIGDDGAVLLADFGLARLGERGFTAPGTVLGTVAYLSPETLWGLEVDERTDLWSLGVMLFEMLSGVRPFVASTPGATLTAILQQPVPSLADLCPGTSEQVLTLTSRLLQKKREQRMASAAEVVTEIESILEALMDAPMDLSAEVSTEVSTTSGWGGGARGL